MRRLCRTPDSPESSYQYYYYSTSILDKLKAPTKSDLARKRKVEPPKTTAANKKHKAGCFSINFPNQSIMLAAALHYAGICSYATTPLLCPKLCQHNSPMPSGRLKNYSGGRKFVLCLVPSLVPSLTVAWSGWGRDYLVP